MGRKDRKTRQIHFRVTEKEYEKIRKKAIHYKSLSSFFMGIVETFDDKYDIKRIYVIEQSGRAFKKWNTDLNKFSANINAIANYCNRCELLGIDDIEPVKETGKYIMQIDDLFKEVNAFHVRFLSFIRRYRAH